MGGMTTLDTASVDGTYAVLADRIESCAGDVSIYSRLPMRQLLRFVASNKAEMWWITEHEGTRSIPPNVVNLEQHITVNTTPTQELLVIEGLDWLVSRNGVQKTLAWLQRLHGQAAELGFDVVLPFDSLSMEAHVWRRISGLAPALSQPNDKEEFDVDATTRLC